MKNEIAKEGRIYTRIPKRNHFLDYFPKADALLSISSFVESFRRSYVRACTLFRSPLEADVIFHFTKWITRLGAEAFPVDTHGCIPDIEINDCIEFAYTEEEIILNRVNDHFYLSFIHRNDSKIWKKLYPIHDWYVFLIIERRYLGRSKKNYVFITDRRSSETNFRFVQ